MKTTRRTAALVMIVFCMAFTTLAQAAGLQKISENVYSYVAAEDASATNSFGANAGIIIGDEFVIAIDTLVSAKEAQRFISDIRQVTDKPVKFVINTHSHLDHTFGNSEFVKLGATIIAHDNCLAAMKEKAAATMENAAAYGLTAEAMAGTEISYPTISFSDSMQIDLGPVSAKLNFFSPSHSEGSVVISVPEQGVLFAGDILFTDFHPYMADADLGGWQKTIDALAQGNSTLIIPGHGPLSTNQDLIALGQYIRLFDATAKKLAQTNKTAEEISTEMKKVLPQRSQGSWIVDANIKSIYSKH